MTEENTPFRHTSSSLGKHTGESLLRTACNSTGSSFLGCADVSPGVRDRRTTVPNVWLSMWEVA